MTGLQKLLAPVLAFSAALAVSGCAGEAYVVTDSPPPPRAEVVTYRPGQVWIEGRWERRGNRWAWREGHYARERPGHVYTAGRWERRGHNYVWIEGGFRRGHVVRR